MRTFINPSRRLIHSILPSIHPFWRVNTVTLFEGWIFFPEAHWPFKKGERIRPSKRVNVFVLQKGWMEGRIEWISLFKKGYSHFEKGEWKDILPIHLFRRVNNPFRKVNKLLERNSPFLNSDFLTIHPSKRVNGWVILPIHPLWRLNLLSRWSFTLRKGWLGRITLPFTLRKEWFILLKGESPWILSWKRVNEKWVNEGWITVLKGEREYYWVILITVTPYLLEHVLITGLRV